MSEKVGLAMGPWAQDCDSRDTYRVTTMSIWTTLRGRAARLRGRSATGAGTVEYVAAIAIAAIIIGAVVVGVNNAKVEVYSARVLCLIQSVVGAGQCDEAIGDGPGSGYGPDNVNEPWYCEVFGIGCSDQPTTDPDDVEIPDGLDRNDPIVQMMLSTERGRQVLQWLADNDIPIVVDPNATGAFWNGSEIVLGPGYDNAAVLVHEANHARYTVEGRMPRSPTRTVTRTCGERSTRRSTAPCSRSCRPRSSATAAPSWGASPGRRNTTPRTSR